MRNIVLRFDMRSAPNFPDALPLLLKADQFGSANCMPVIVFHFCQVEML